MELAEGEVMSPFGEDVAAGSAPNDSILSEGNQCQLVKLPALTRQQNVSPFTEEEKKGGGGLHRPSVVDMVKPQAPMEGAWSKLTPPPSTRTSTDSSGSVYTPKITRVAPSEGDGNDRPSRISDQSVFIASSPSNPTTPTHESPAKTHRRKSKCVVS